MFATAGRGDGGDGGDDGGGGDNGGGGGGNDQVGVGLIYLLTHGYSRFKEASMSVLKSMYQQLRLSRR